MLKYFIHEALIPKHKLFSDKLLHKIKVNCFFPVDLSNTFFFQISLDPPIKQGQTRYHFCILLFNIDDEMSIELGISE